MLLKIRLQPGAKKATLASWRGVAPTADGTLKISVTAPALDGRANNALIGFLSEHYNVPKSRVRIVRGEKSRNKVVEIIYGSSTPPLLHG